MLLGKNFLSDIVTWKICQMHMAFNKDARVQMLGRRKEAGLLGPYRQAKGFCSPTCVRGRKGDQPFEIVG